MEAPSRDGATRPNPTDSDTYAVLRHENGELEVWDCEAFGPWSLAAGPFTGEDACYRAHAAYDEMGGRYAEIVVPGQTWTRDGQMFHVDRVNRFAAFGAWVKDGVEQQTHTMKAGLANGWRLVEPGEEA